MFEASTNQATVWKKVIETMKDLVTEANLDCNPAGVTIQAIDTSHVALVHLLLHYDGFADYNCEHGALMGINMHALSRVLRTIDNNDQLTLRREGDDVDTLSIASQNSDTSKMTLFTLKLMEIESESLQIPEMEYRTRVTLPASEFAKIVKDMATFGDTVTVHVDRQGVKFSVAGDIGEGSAFIRAGTAGTADGVGFTNSSSSTTDGSGGAAAAAAAPNPVKMENNDAPAAPADVKAERRTAVKGERSEDAATGEAVMVDETEGGGGEAPQMQQAKQEQPPPHAKQEPKPEEVEQQQQQQGEEPTNKAVKSEDGAASAGASARNAAAAPAANNNNNKNNNNNNNNKSLASAVEVMLDEPVALSFALRFFNIFGRGASLSDSVTLCFAREAPCLVEYKIEGMGYLRFYLAPKLDE